MGTKLSALPAADTLSGTEIAPVVQSGATKRTTAAALAALATANGAARTDLANVATGFAPIFGGATNAYPALKRNGAVLEARHADDSAYADFSASTLKTYGFKLDFLSRGSLQASGDGLFLLTNSSGSNIDRLQIGGATSGFPAITRNGSNLALRLADNSGDAGIQAQTFVAVGYQFIFNARGAMTAPSNGVWTFSDAAGTDFGRLQFGGTTASFPALKRTNAQLDIRLADDSAFANLACQNITVHGGGYFFNSNGSFQVVGDGVFRMQNAAGTDFGRLILGPSASASFPALKRNGTTVQVRLADDSDNAHLLASTVRTVAVAVASLPAPAAIGNGGRAMVTDSNATLAAGLGNTVAGGGANSVPVYCDGTNWRIG